MKKRAKDAEKAWKTLEDTNRIKIVSDGTSRGTYVCNSQTGLKIDRITKIKIEIDAAHQLPVATIEILNPILEIEAPSKSVVVKYKNVTS